MLSGQTVEAFLISIAHAQPLIVGLNCALGPDEMEPYVEELARISPYSMSAHPNAGLPDPLSETGFPETPKTFTPKVAKWVENGWLNLIGGCCGTTPEHIRALAAAVRDFAPRRVASHDRAPAREDTRAPQSAIRSPRDEFAAGDLAAVQQRRGRGLALWPISFHAGRIGYRSR